MTTVLHAARPAAARGRAPARPTLAELEQACARCDHQNGGHTRGGDRDAWWQATGGCAVPGCPCPGRTNDPSAAPSRPQDAPTTLTPPPRIPTRLSGPCGHGEGPCGATPTRPYASGPRCREHEPVAITRSTP